MVSHGYPLLATLNDPASRAATALAAYKWSPYIRQAERAIKSRLATIPWWLEDGDGERITDESRPELVAIRDRIETPYKPDPGDGESPSPKTRAGLWDLTFRHMGLAGVGFWFLDGINALGGTPLQTLYISPQRLTPDLDDAGRLTGWWLDYRRTFQRAVHFDLNEIVPFYLEPADDGFLPTGLVDTALAKAELARIGDRHGAGVMSSGGRRAGIYSPTGEGSMPDEVFEALKRDLRAIVEMPDAAKRSMILKGPVGFTPTDQPVDDLQLLDIMAMARDDILALWGVPKSQVGYERPSGLGDASEDKDYEMMWHGSLGPRLRAFGETMQTQYLDRYARLGIELTIHFDIPEFDDESPLYDMADKAKIIPLTTAERRAIIGLDAFGDDRDEVVWMPRDIVPVQAESGIGRETVESIGTLIRSGFQPGAIEASLGAPPIPHTGAAPVTVQAMKAKAPTEDKVTAALERFLLLQARRVSRRIEANSGHIAKKPRDVSTYWNTEEEDAELLKVLSPLMLAAAEAEAVSAARAMPAKASLPTEALGKIGASTVKRLAARVRGINRTTRDRIRDLIVEGIDAGLSPAEVGRGLRGTIPPLPDDAVGRALGEKLGNFGSELRAETIARTEMRVAQNAAQIDSFSALGAEQVELIDGDDDAACAARNGRVVSMEEAESMMLAEHPNGTLTFAPVV
jgi:hypothetical protein